MNEENIGRLKHNSYYNYLLDSLYQNSDVTPENLA